MALASQTISRDFVSSRCVLSRQSARPKNSASNPILAIMEADSLEWPKGSICQPMRGAAHFPIVSFSFLQKFTFNNNILPSVLTTRYMGERTESLKSCVNNDAYEILLVAHKKNLNIVQFKFIQINAEAPFQIVNTDHSRF